MVNIPYGRQYIDERDIKEVVAVLRSDWVTQGPKIAEFEDRLKKYCGSKYCVTVSSGTAALHIACLASGLKSGDEAVTSPMTFVATANSILYTGARPVFADVDEGTSNIDEDEIAKKITGKTRVILPVHFGGLPCDMRVISNIAGKSGIMVIEDACHALGASYGAGDKRKKVGCCEYSDMTVFSFHPVKSITTGEGGAVLTNNAALYKKLLMLRSHGIVKDDFMKEPDGEWYYEMQELGFNYRMTDIQAALGISQLKKLDGFIAKRRIIANIYDRTFAHNEWFDLPAKGNFARSSCHLYCLKLKGRLKNKRKDIFSMLRARGIGAQIHYIPVYRQPYYRRIGYMEGSCPVAEDLYQRMVTIPLYPGMTKKDISFVIKNITEVFEYASKR